MAQSDCVKFLFEKISKNDFYAVESILSSTRIHPEIYDDNGMTPLQHAACRGNKDIMRLLLNQGANVNSSKHEYGYTALHFAALSGNADVCQILLENGAKVHTTNSIGRTPAQMAAFVGNHSCVAVINNFVPKSDIEPYTVVSGFEKEPKLPMSLADPLHKFVLQVNMSPVKVAMNLRRSYAIYENLDKISKVLELMSEKEMRRGVDTNEVISFKFHYLSCILADVSKFKAQILAQAKKETDDKTQEEKKKKKLNAIDFFIKKMLQVKKGPYPEFQEDFLKDCVMTFSNRECTIFRQMVSILARPDPPSALTVVVASINGQRVFMDSDVITCTTCNEEKVTKKCSKCKAVHYCDRECQKLHWFVHKRFCDELSRRPVVSRPASASARASDNATELSAAAEALVSEISSLQLD